MKREYVVMVGRRRVKVQAKSTDEAAVLAVQQTGRHRAYRNVEVEGEQLTVRKSANGWYAFSRED